MKKSLFISFCFTCIGWLSSSWTLPDHHKPVIPVNSIAVTDSLGDATSSIYEFLELETLGLSKKAFNAAYKGYKKLITKKKISSDAYLIVCDFSQSSRKKRLYIIDVENRELIKQTFVAHGRNSGKEYATRFSNKSRSLQSSLGFYITDKTYFGEHGLSLRIRGLEPGFNDKALKRNIVVHGADYLEESWVEKNQGAMGRSFGCPAIPKNESEEIINTIKNGNCLFIYHPSKNYLKGSKILNG